MNLQEKGRKSIALNNLGVSYIESEDYHYAIKILRKALRRCQKVVRRIEQRQQLENEINNKMQVDDNNNIDDDEEDDNVMYRLDSWMSGGNRFEQQQQQSFQSNNHHNNDKEAYLDMQAPSSSSPSSSTGGAFNNKKNYNNNSTTTICRRTIIVPPNIPESKIKMVPVAIIYNLALAHHLYAIEKNNDMGLLTRADELYDFVLEYHLTTNTSLSTCMVFVMACLNNLGHIHYKFQDKDMEKFFLEKLLSILMCIVDNFSIDERPCDLDIFFQSTMHLVLPNHMTLAAAA